MEGRNQTHVTEFILLGLSDEGELQSLLFWPFLSMYLVTFTGNLLMILAIITDSRLHTPMYFFLSNLCFSDICFTSTTVPKMLLNIQTQSKVISYKGCLSQMYFFMLFGVLDTFLLTVMAYDRFVAICHPLHYMVIMNPKFCGILLLVCWLLSIFNSLLHDLLILRLSFCTDLEILHFVCELNQVIQLACSDTFLNDLMIYVTSGLLGVFPLTGILFSYSRIVTSILRISSVRGKYKAFSTCGSHLSVVSLFYGTSLGVYLSSAAAQNSRTSAIASVMYTVVTPMLNPFIYGLRNRDIKQALETLGTCCFTSLPLAPGNKMSQGIERQKNTSSTGLLGIQLLKPQKFLNASTRPSKVNSTNFGCLGTYSLFGGNRTTGSPQLDLTVETSATGLENLNEVGVIGSWDGRGQVAASTTKGKVQMIAVVDWNSLTYSNGWW
ncbi:olfactory receptor 7A10-like [Prionailurus bengalensis]|uniref:olfactory receptor 7A10-like n=1 Tax=Prionailurus bengalensis TaxID=37029 RepID=UPI001CA7DEE7|nr:olfactory receptor 7A10-like [Prionailurus bengalensis]